MAKQQIGEINGKPIFLEGLNVFSEDNEYFFSFVTPDSGMKSRETKEIPYEILRKASSLIFGKDTADLYFGKKGPE